MDGGFPDLIARWNRRATRWLAYIAAVVLALIAVVTFCDVIGRYVFNRPFTFTVEMTELAMGLIVFLGIGLTTHEDGHITVDVVTLRLPFRLRALLAVVTNILSLGFVALMVWRLWLQAELLLDKGDLTPILLVPVWPVAFIAAAGSCFLLTGVFMHLVTALWRFMGWQGAPSAAGPQRPYSE